MSDLRNKLENLLNSQQIKIKPRWQHVLGVFLGLLSVSFFLLFSSLIFSFLIFKTRGLPPFEMGKIMFNLHNIPILLFAILFLISGIVFVLHKKYNFVYKKPAIITILLLLFVTFVTSFIIDKEMLHDRILRGVRNRDIHYIRNFYEDDRFSNVESGYRRTIDGRNTVKDFDFIDINKDMGMQR